MIELVGTTAHPMLALTGGGVPPRRVALEGPRARVVAEPGGDADGWRVELPLTLRRWGRAERPVPSGRYRLVGVEATQLRLERAELGPLAVEVEGAAVRIDPPIDAAAAAAAERDYLAAGGALDNAVFFESFYGRVAGCNPRAIDAEIARQAPGVVRYWSVIDHSVDVPDGAVAIVEGSAEWWRARARARTLVVNDWLRRAFVRRRGQRVLQTWHGTPLKRLAWHRPGFDPRRRLAVLREQRRWDVLLAQNPYAARVLRSAYRFRGPVWVEGYPRNDALHEPVRAQLRRRVRAALDLPAEARVVLYAPTWRDDRAEIVDFVDPVALAARTDSVVLVRGHSRTLLPGRDAQGDGVVDVTGYPDVTDLLAAADVLVTDYSSVMFDAAATALPIVLFTPDLEHYRGALRGFYFDVGAEAPGPVVSDVDALVDALTDPGLGDTDTPAYRRWRARFADREDGGAAARVVARMLDQGMISR